MKKVSLSEVIDLEGDYRENEIMHDIKRLEQASKLFNDCEEALVDVFRTKLKDLSYQLINNLDQEDRKHIIRAITEIKELHNRIRGYAVEDDSRNEPEPEIMTAEDLADSEKY